jgi:hypothetical protein
MSALFGSNQPTNTTPDYTGLQVQTAVATLPVPVVWGMARIAPNVIWYANFQIQPGSSSTGKGGIFGNGSSNQTSYSADLIMALCEGPIVNVNNVWKGQSVYTLASLGLGLFTGTTPQGVWNYLQARYPRYQAIAYQGTAILVAANYQLTSSATIDNHNFEVQGLRYGTGYAQLGLAYYVGVSGLPFNGANPATGYFDADPSYCIWDFLTSSQFGVGLPQASIDQTTLFTQGGGNDAAVQTYCRALGIALSPALNDQETASSILERWLQIINVAAVWSNGTLRFIPYGDTAVTGNGISYVPDTTPIYNLGDDDFIDAKGSDPLQVSVSDLYEAYNVWRLECNDRNNQYALTTVEARDQNAIEQTADATGTSGIRIAPTVTAHDIADPLVAAICAQLMLQRSVYIRNTYKFTLGWEYCLLDPMDLVTVTDTILGLFNTAIRITAIEEDDKGLLQISAEEYPQGVASAVLYPIATASGNSVDRNQGVGSVNAPIIFEPTDALAAAMVSGGGLLLAFAVSCPNKLAGGAQVLMSISPDGNYTPIGKASLARQGVLSGTLLSVAANPTGAATIDTANAVAVDLTQSNGSLPVGSQADALALNDACYVGGEIVSYGAASLIAANKYNLSYFVRGAYDTEDAIANHAAGTQFALLDSAIFKWAFDQSRIGQTLYFKFPTFNAWGGGPQAIEDCSSYAYTITGAALYSPLPNVANLRNVYNANIGFQQLVWDKVVDFRAVTYEVRSGTSWDAAITLDGDASSPFTVPGDGTYWVSAVAQPTSGRKVYSETPQSVTIAGSVITQTIIKTVDLKALNWPGTFTGGAGIDGALNAIRTGGGDILSDPDVLGTSDILNYGGGQSGIYFPDDNALLDIGYVATASVVIEYQPTGVPVAQDILTNADVLNTADILGSVSTQFINAYPQVNTASSAAGDLYAVGDLYAPTGFFPGADLYAIGDAAWNGWTKFTPGTYQTRFLYFSFVLDTFDVDTIAYNLAFKITITIPPRIDQYALTTSAGADTTVTFAPTGQSAAPFNGGPGPSNLPALNWGIVNAQAGDDLIVTALSLSSISFNIQNGGTRVVRNLTLEAEGY